MAAGSIIPPLTPAGELREIVFNQLREFFGLFNTHGGPRLAADQNIVDGALAAIVRPDIFDKRQGRMFQRAFNVNIWSSQASIASTGSNR